MNAKHITFSGGWLKGKKDGKGTFVDLISRDFYYGGY
jgi:hypothetical protein